MLPRLYVADLVQRFMVVIKYFPTLVKEYKPIIDELCACRNSLPDDKRNRLQQLVKTLEATHNVSSPKQIELVRTIMTELRLTPQHVYKCPKGHFYFIGECGGAMEQSRCPDCGAGIGGGQHSALPGNQHAGG